MADPGGISKSMMTQLPKCKRMVGQNEADVNQP